MQYMKYLGAVLERNFANLNELSVSKKFISADFL